MPSFDFSPLFRSTIGFDRLSRLVDSAMNQDSGATSYPPYNIEVTGEDAYRITMAVAGFAPQQLEVVVQDNQLVIRGTTKPEETERKFLHRGIAGRAFERRFQLADTIRVVGADLENGLLHVALVREVPEALKPRTIAIKNGSKPTVIESKAA